VPQPKFFFELAGLMNYICDLITKDPEANNKDTCKANLPKTMPSPAAALGPAASFRIGDVVTPITSRPVPRSIGAAPSGIPTAPPKPTFTSKTKLNNFEISLSRFDVQQFQNAVCVTLTGEDNLGELGSETRLAIQKVLNSPDQVMTDRKGILLRKRLKDGVTCPPK